MNTKIYFGIMLATTVFLISCGKKDQVDLTTPPTSAQEPLDRIGTWAGKDADGKTNEIIVTKDKYGECAWVERPPDGTHDVKGCISYWEGGDSDQQLIKKMVDEYVAKEKESINYGDKQRQPNEKSNVKESLEQLEETKKKYYKVLSLMSDAKFKIIETEYEEEGSGDCINFDLMNSKYLYGVSNCMGSNNGFIIDLFQKK